MIDIVPEPTDVFGTLKPWNPVWGHFSQLTEKIVSYETKQP